MLQIPNAPINTSPSPGEIFEKRSSDEDNIKQMQAIDAVAAKIIHSLFSSAAFWGGTERTDRLRFLTNMIYFDRFTSVITAIKASKNIKNKLKQLDREKLFAVVTKFINFHFGSLGPNGDIDTKNSYIISAKYIVIFNNNNFRSQIYHVSVA